MMKLVEEQQVVPILVGIAASGTPTTEARPAGAPMM
jgi:hypothetical protein